MFRSTAFNDSLKCGVLRENEGFHLLKYTRDGKLSSALHMNCTQIHISPGVVSRNIRILSFHYAGKKSREGFDVSKLYYCLLLTPSFSPQSRLPLLPIRISASCSLRSNQVGSNAPRRAHPPSPRARPSLGKTNVGVMTPILIPHASCKPQRPVFPSFSPHDKKPYS